MKLTVQVDVAAPLAVVWRAWTRPHDIMQWNFASPDWNCPAAEIDLAVGGQFNYRMEARDGSMGFDFSGTFTAVEEERELAYSLGDNRSVVIKFEETDGAVRLTQTFDADSEHPTGQQEAGWQAILESFKKHVETIAI